jgi:hypothetical protein
VCGVTNIHRVEICCIGSSGTAKEFMSVSQVIFTPIVKFIEKIGPHPLHNGSTINTHAPSTIFLRKQNNKNDIKTKAFSYIPVVQKLLDLSLNFLSLFQIGPICSTVCQCCSQVQVNLMFNSSQLWQSRGYVGRKNVLKFLQKVSDSVRQMYSNIIKRK